jgi:hypothetical protein
MKTVWKFELNSEEVNTVYTPISSELLTVQFQKVRGMNVQQEVLCAWFIVDSAQPPLEMHHIVLVTTGNEFPQVNYQACKYISTVQRNGIVLHVFEERI